MNEILNLMGYIGLFAAIAIFGYAERKDRDAIRAEAEKANDIHESMVDVN